MDDFNKNWESEIAKYDAESSKREKEFRRSHMVIPDSGLDSLDDAENEVLRLLLLGRSCQQIAKETETDTAMVYGLFEIIRAKLSVES